MVVRSRSHPTVSIGTHQGESMRAPHIPAMCPWAPTLVRVLVLVLYSIHSHRPGLMMSHHRISLLDGCSDAHGPPPSISTPSTGRASPPQYVDHSHHHLVPLHTLEGFAPKKQMRCQMCNRLTSWACAECSRGRFAVVPIHPPQTKNGGNIVHWTCLCEHRANPFSYPRGKSCKRARSSPSSEWLQGNTRFYFLLK